MKNPWIRLYREALHNPKVVTLNDRQHRAWHNCMLIADDAGQLPKWRDMACHMRMTVQEVEQVICELVEAGLIDIEGFGPDRVFKLHDWQEHQYVSDNSTERVRKFRNKSKTATDETATKREGNVSETPPEQSRAYTETDSESIAPPLAPVRGSGFKHVGDLGLGSRGVSPRLKERAEGLGLPIDELMQRATAPDVKTPNAMFRHLAVEKLHRKLPLAKKELLAAALTKDGGQAFGLVSQMLLVGA